MNHPVYKGYGHKISLLKVLKQQFPQTDIDRLLALVACGHVLVDREKVTDHRVNIDPQAAIEIHDFPAYVSRGGEKLGPILDAWQIPVNNKVFLDAGASTGGFTDCLLQRGAQQVYAVDVGYNQLDFKLRKDPRVTVWERKNIMQVGREDFARLPDCAVCDLSFRSVRGVAEHLLSLVKDDIVITLIKPQFEWKNPAPSFDGVIRSPAVLNEILLDLVVELTERGLGIRQIAVSPLKGRQGNTEFFLLLSATGGLAPGALEARVDSLTRKAFL